MNPDSVSAQVPDIADGVRIKMNDRAEVYRTGNTMMTNDAILFLEQYKHIIKWKQSGDRSIDIGCADGGVTSIIEKYLPANYEELFACDLNEKMVAFANRNYGNERKKFQVLDIEGEMANDLRGKFDHVFSFYTLHWIRKQEKAFKNVYDLLAEDGDCLLTITARHTVYEVYQSLTKMKKWSSHLKNIDHFVSPYHSCQEPDKILYDITKKIGFKEIDVKCKQMVYVYNSIDAFKNLMNAINPFDIPNGLMDEFMADVEVLVREMRLVQHNGNGVDTVICSYNTLVIYAKKT